MTNTYYLVVNGQKTGPYTPDELKTNGLNRDSLVWTTGLDSWTRADQVESLKEILQTIPPPITTSISQVQGPGIAPPPLPKDYLRSPSFGYEIARKRDRFFAVILESIVIGIPLMVVFGDIFNEGFEDPAPILLGIIISAAFGAIFYPMWSGNLGHKIMGLKVISAADGKDVVSALEGAKREALKNLFSYFFIPVIWLLWDDRHQNLYDKVVKTLVVKKKPAE